MKLDIPVPFEQRYDLRKRLWNDGPHQGWLALDRTLGREVVVNIPYRPEDDQRLLQMAQLRARLRHASLIPIYDLGVTKDGKPFFTEPYIKGTDIERLRRDGDDGGEDATLPRLVSYLLDVCKAVAFLHANGYAHLDLNAANVLVAPESQEVFVVCHQGSLLPLRDEGSGAGAMPKSAAIGRPAYMAPEQLDRERMGATDVLTNVYYLGGILFVILYDNPPNVTERASLTEILTALTARKGPPERRAFGNRAARRLELARKLEPVCLRALDADRTARPVSVPAFMKEVEHCAWG